MEIGKWKMAQTWRHFKRPASSKGLWKQFVDASKERDRMAQGGVPQLVQPGRMEFKRGRIVPPKTTAADVKRLKPDFLGKFEGRNVREDTLGDALEVYNTIKKKKGRIVSLDALGKLTWGSDFTNSKKTQLALDLLKTGDFADDIKDFKFLKDLYPKLDHKGFRNLDMVADSIINYRGTIGIDRDEALAQFLPENMSNIIVEPLNMEI